MKSFLSAWRTETIFNRILFSQTLQDLLQDKHWLHKKNLCLYHWLRKVDIGNIIHTMWSSQSHSESKLKLMKWHSQNLLGYRIPGSISFAVTLRAPPFIAAIAHAPLPLPTSNTCRPNISCGLSSIYLQPGTELTFPGFLKIKKTVQIKQFRKCWTMMVCLLLCNSVTPNIFSIS